MGLRADFPDEEDTEEPDSRTHAGFEQPRDQAHPFFSVLVSAYNRAQPLDRCLRSVLYQTFRDFEVVVVDDASTDATQALPAGVVDPRLRVIRHERNRGISPSRATAVNHARGEWFVIMDSDWELFPHTLARLHAIIDTRPANVRIIRSRLQDDDGNLQPGVMPSGVTGYHERLQWMEKLAAAQTSADAGHCIHRSVFQTVNYFEDRRGAMELLWETDLARNELSLWVSDVLGLQHADAANSHSRDVDASRLVPRLLADAPDALWMAETMLREHGEELARYAPRVRRSLIERAATQAFFNGKRLAGARYGRCALSSGPGRAKMLGTVALGLLGPRALARAYVLARRRRFQNTSRAAQSAPHTTIDVGSPTTATTPTCTVVMAAYNASATIDQSIASVLAQTRRDFELIVIDDGSTDDTASRARQYDSDPRVRFLHQPNAGPAKARNTAINLARGRYVSILDSDDLWLPDYLERMVGALEANPEAAIAYTRAWVVETATNRFRRTTWPVRLPRIPTGDPEALLRGLVAENFINGLATIRRDVLSEVGGYDPWVGVAEDYELWLRIATAGYGAVQVDGPLIICRNRSDSLTKDDRAMCAGKQRAFERLLARPSLPPDVRPLAEQTLAETTRLVEKLAGKRRLTAAERLRILGGVVTRPVRERLRQLGSPPEEVAASFPGLGTGARPPVQRQTEIQPNGSPASLTTTVVKGAGISGAGYVVAQAISFASYLVLARLLTPSQFGTFAAGLVVAGIGTVLGESGLLAALIQRRDRLEEALESAFVATVVSGVLLSLLALAAAPLVGLFFHSSTAALVAAVMSASMLFRLVEIVPSALLQRRFAFVRRVAIDPLGMLAFAAGSIIPAIAGLGVWSLVIGTYAQYAVSLVGAWWFAGWVPHPRRATVRVWRELARFGRPLVLAELIRRAIPELPVVALGRFAGAGAIGQYSYALRVANQAPDAIVSIGSYVLLPALARLADNQRRFTAALTRAVRWMCGLSFPLGMLLVTLGTPAIVLVFGARWHAAGEAVIPLGVYAGVLALDSIASEVWKAAGATEMLPRMHGLSFVLMAVLIVALGVPFGLIGVTSAIAASGVGVAAYAVYGIHRVTGVSLSRLLGEISPAATAALTVGAGLFCLEHLVVHSAAHGTLAGIAMLAAETVLGAVAYLVCFSMVSAGARADLAAAIDSLRQDRRSKDRRPRVATLLGGSS